MSVQLASRPYVTFIYGNTDYTLIGVIMANSGSAIASQTFVNANEFIYEIKEGEMKNYSWDNATSAWTPIVSFSGQSQTVFTQQLAYQTIWTSGLTLGSGNLVSGGYVSCAITATTPIYLRYAQMSFLSGTPTGSMFAVKVTPAVGFGAVTLATGAVTAAGSYVTPTVTPYILLSGDTVTATTISGTTSGMTYTARIVCSQ